MSDTVVHLTRRIEVLNPATGETVGEVPDLASDEVAALVDRGRAAQPGWLALGFAERSRLVRALGAWAVRNRAPLLDAMVAEAGKTYDDALFELAFLPLCCDFWAKHGPRYLREERARARSPFLLGSTIVTRWEPLGVVGVIAPWNYPLLLGIGDAVPALTAGNAVVLKPSEITPLSSLVLARGAAEVGFPPDVLQVATGGAIAGTALVDAADMIMFTGSTRTGRTIAEQAGRRLIPVSLELGGKDPMIVLADADLDHAVDQALTKGLFNAGQTCMAVERVYVEAPVYDDFVDRLVGRARRLRQGPPGAPGTVDVGSLTGPDQPDLVARHVDEARDKGARVLLGGNRGSHGFYEPTIVVDVDRTMALMTEETFGPVLPVVRVRDVEEAISSANDSDYGLNASVFTRDRARGEGIARRLESGSVCVNSVAMNYAELAAPFGGWKRSGLGGRHAAGGIRKYCRSQTILLAGRATKWDPAAFPKTPRKSKFLERAVALAYGRSR